MKTEMGVVIYIYLKHSPNYIDSKYIWVHWSNSQGSSVFTEIPFLTFLAVYWERKRYGQVGPSTYYSQNEVICAYQVLDLQLSRELCGKNTNFVFSHYHVNHFFRIFLARVLSWVKPPPSSPNCS